MFGVKTVLQFAFNYGDEHQKKKVCLRRSPRKFRARAKFQKIAKAIKLSTNTWFSVGAPKRIGIRVPRSRNDPQKRLSELVLRVK